MPEYKVLNGLNYGDKRAEAGDVVSDLPSKSVTWLLDRGHIQPVEKKPAPKAKGGK